MFVCKYCNRVCKNIKSLSAHLGNSHKEELKSLEVFPGITKKQLEEMRNNATNCMICGKKETANTRPDVKTTPNKLCADHSHTTGEFRGFLCVQCNRNMGWYDKYHDKIFSYDNTVKK